MRPREADDSQICFLIVRVVGLLAVKWKTQWCIRKCVILDQSSNFSCAQVISIGNMNNWNSYSHKSGLIQKTADVVHTQQGNWNLFQKARILCFKETIISLRVVSPIHNRRSSIISVIGAPFPNGKPSGYMLMKTTIPSIFSPLSALPLIRIEKKIWDFHFLKEIRKKYEILKIAGRARARKRKPKFPFVTP